MKYHHNISSNHTLKRHVEKLNEIFYRIKYYEQQCDLLRLFLNQGELAYHIPLVGIKDDGFHLQCISNSKHLVSDFLKQYHQKTMVKYVWIETLIIIHFLFHFLQLHLPLPQQITHVNKHIIHIQSYRIVMPHSYSHHLMFHTGKFVMLGRNNEH